MEFKLKTAGYFYSDEDAEKYRKLGFKFSVYKDAFNPNRKNVIDGDPTISFSSLEELMSFIEEWGDVVVSNGEIRIYDNYLE